MSRPEAKPIRSVNMAPEEIGEIARELCEHTQKAEGLIKNYIPDDTRVTVIFEAAKDIQQSDNSFDPVADCLNKALEAAYVPGNAMGNMYPHPIDFLTAAKIFDRNEQSSKKLRVSPEQQLWVLGVTEYTLSNTKNLSKERHRNEASTLFSLSLDIERERARMQGLKQAELKSD